MTATLRTTQSPLLTRKTQPAPPAAARRDAAIAAANRAAQADLEAAVAANLADLDRRLAKLEGRP